jgi:hypothetical protein
MKNRLLLGAAALVVGLAYASSASAALTYFDAQIVDIPSGKTVIPKNTVMCDPGQNCAETAFTALPNGPGTEGPPPTTQVGGNWTLNGANPIAPATAVGNDNAWNQRVNNAFGNPDASTSGTIYESRGNGTGQLDNAPTLKTTIDVLAADVGTTRGVYVLFWTDQSGGLDTTPDALDPVQQGWRISACLDCKDDDRMPVYVGSDHSPTGYVFGVYDVGAGDPGNISPLDLEMNGYTTSDGMPTGSGGTNRRLKAAWLGNVELGATLSVFVGDGPPLHLNLADSNNNRTWYDGIAYGETQDLVPLSCDIPEPATVVLFGLGLIGVAGLRRQVR